MTTARISVEYIPNENNNISNLIASEDSCNVSHLEYITQSTQEYQGFNGFHLSNTYGNYVSTLSGDFKCYADEGYKGYCSNILSNNVGYIGIVFSFYFLKVPRMLAINFDRVSNTYAKTIVISNSENSNSITINNTNTLCLINLTDLNIVENNTRIFIQFESLNKAYSNLKITKLAFEYIKTYDDDIIKNFKCSEQLLDTTFNINPNVLQQYAEIVFKDKYGEFKTLAKSELLNDNLLIKIYIGEQLVGTYLTESWNITASDTNVSLNCTDPSRLFDYINISKIPVQHRNVDDLLNLAFSYTDYTFAYLDKEIETLCKQVISPDSWTYVTSLSDFIQKICLLGMIRIYWYIDKFIVARCY